MGGRIGVESELGRGQHVLVHRPTCRWRAAAPAAPPRDLDGPARAGRRRQRDQPRDPRAPARVWGMRSETVAGGEAGLERIRARAAAAARAVRPGAARPHMPGLDGLGVAARARRRDGPAVILLTSAGAHARRAGRDARRSPSRSRVAPVRRDRHGDDRRRRARSAGARAARAPRARRRIDPARRGQPDQSGGRGQHPAPPRLPRRRRRPRRARPSMPCAASPTPPC